MICSSTFRKAVVYSAVFLAGAAVAYAVPMNAREAPKAEDPPYRGLDANLWMQISGEYKACCLQAYNLGTRRLTESLAAQIETRTPASARPAAVIMDLDETVLDNGAFQSFGLRKNLAFEQANFDRWEEVGGQDVRLIPGSLEFIQDAFKKDVKVYYITNRNDRYREKTLKTLEDLKIGVPSEQLLCASKETGSDKTGRRELVEKKFNVLLYFGDNLRDFDDKYRSSAKSTNSPEQIAKSIADRKDAVNKDRENWGRHWIILPNPAYGEWQKVLGRGEKDLDLLIPSAKLD